MAAGVHAIEYVGAMLNGGVVVSDFLNVGIVEAVILELRVVRLLTRRAGADCEGADGQGIFLHQRGYLEFLKIDHAASSLNIFIAENQISICIRNPTCILNPKPPSPFTKHKISHPKFHHRFINPNFL